MVTEPDLETLAKGVIRASELGCQLDTFTMREIYLAMHRPAMVTAAMLDRMRDLSSKVGAGLADSETDPLKLLDRIEWGIDHIASVEAKRAGDLIEELSKTPKTTWGQVRTAIIERAYGADGDLAMHRPAMVTDAPNLDTATDEQIQRANAAVEANLKDDGTPKWDSAQGYACALTAIMQTDLAMHRAASGDVVEEIDARTRRLIIAARNLAYSDAYYAKARPLVAELDAAVEAFATDLPWDDDPASLLGSRIEEDKLSD